MYGVPENRKIFGEKFDHSLSHFHARSTRIQWRNCGQRAPRGSIFCSRKHMKELKSAIYCAFGTFWDVDAAGSSPVTPTKNQPKTSLFRLISAVFLYIFHKFGCFQLTTCLPYFSDFIGFFIAFSQLFGKSLFFVFCDANFEG